MLQLNYRDTKPIYEQIKDGVRKLLLSNVIHADEKLPSVRELASSLAINPNTIQRAYKELEADGYLYTKQGKGTFAASGIDIYQIRKQELIHNFDESVEELLYMAVSSEELKNRIEQLEQGGMEE